MVFVWQHRWGTSQFQREKIYLCEENGEKPKKGELGGVLFLPRSSILSSLTGFLISGLFHPGPLQGSADGSHLQQVRRHKIYVYEKENESGGGYLWKKSYLFAVFVVLFLQLCVTALFMWL